MQLNYKPGIEIAEEEAINTILEDNHFIDIKKRVDYDLTVLGLGVVKHEFLPGNGVTVSYVDPANVVYSYTEDPYFKDCFYWGEIKTVPLTELIKIDPSLTTEDLKFLIDNGANINSEHNGHDLLSICFKNKPKFDIIKFEHLNHKVQDLLEMV